MVLVHGGVNGTVLVHAQRGGDHPDTARSTRRYWRIHAWQPRYQGCEKPVRLGHLQMPRSPTALC
jgi:hypothetical protein